jgi:hypothetical protein
MVNCVPKFGAPHRVNRKVRSQYAELTAGRDFRADVDDLWKQTLSKVKITPKVKILTIADGDLRHRFLEPLHRRREYATLDVEKACADIRFQKKVLRRISAKRQRPTAFTLYEASSLPIQLLVVGLPSAGGKKGTKFGCLVFMLGSETIEETKSGQEIGFYSEFFLTAALYRRLAEELIAQAKVSTGCRRA